MASMDCGPSLACHAPESVDQVTSVDSLGSSSFQPMTSSADVPSPVYLADTMPHVSSAAVDSSSVVAFVLNAKRFDHAP